MPDTFQSRESYVHELESPQWKLRSLQIRTRDHFRCQHPGCRSKGPLHVHHLLYIRGRLPHQYRWDDLTTLCALHHQEAHIGKNPAQLQLALTPWKTGKPLQYGNAQRIERRQAAPEKVAPPARPRRNKITWAPIMHQLKLKLK